MTHMLFPHDLFHMVYSRFRQEFEIHFGAKPEELERFWTQFLQTPYGKTASCRIEALRGKTAQQLDHCIPLIVHGDGCPITHKKSALFVQWGGLLGTRSIKITRLFGTR